MVNTILIARRNRAARLIRETERFAGQRLSRQARLDLARKLGVRSPRQLELGLRATSQAVRTTGGATFGGRAVGVTRAEQTAAFQQRARLQQVERRAQALQTRQRAAAQEVQRVTGVPQVMQAPRGPPVSAVVEAGRVPLTRPRTLPPSIQQIIGAPTVQRSPVFRQAPRVQRILELEIARGIRGTPAFRTRVESLQRAERRQLTRTITGGAVVPVGGRQAVFENLVITPLPTEAVDRQRLQRREAELERQRSPILRRRRELVLTAESLRRQEEIAKQRETIARQPRSFDIFQQVEQRIIRKKAATGQIIAGFGIGTANVLRFAKERPKTFLGLAAGAAALPVIAPVVAGTAIGTIAAGPLVPSVFAGVAIGVGVTRAVRDPFFRTKAGVAAQVSEAASFAVVSGAFEKGFRGARAIFATPQVSRIGTKIETATVLTRAQARTAARGRIQFRIDKRTGTAKIIGKTVTKPIKGLGKRFAESESEFQFLVGKAKKPITATVRGRIVQERGITRGVFAGRIGEGISQKRFLTVLRARRIATDEGLDVIAFGTRARGPRAREGFGSGVLRETLIRDVDGKRLVRAEFLGKRIKTPKEPEIFRAFAGRRGQISITRPRPTRPITRTRPSDFTGPLGEVILGQALRITRPVSRRIFIAGQVTGQAALTRGDVLIRPVQTVSVVPQVIPAAPITTPIITPVVAQEIIQVPAQEQAITPITTVVPVTTPVTRFVRPIIPEAPFGPPRVRGAPPVVPLFPTLVFPPFRRRRRGPQRVRQFRFTTSIVALELGITSRDVDITGRRFIGTEVRPIIIGPPPTARRRKKKKKKKIRR